MNLNPVAVRAIVLQPLRDNINAELKGELDPTKREAVLVVLRAINKVLIDDGDRA